LRQETGDRKKDKRPKIKVLVKEKRLKRKEKRKRILQRNEL